MWGLWIALALTLAVRVAAMMLIANPVESDALSYFTMAERLATGLPMRDQFGQVAFYSPGYPLLLGAVFVAVGVSVKAALAANIALATLSCWLVHAIAMRVSRSPLAAGLAAAGFALWIPAAIGVTFLHKENLSTPLLLGLVLCLLRFDELPSVGRALAAGLLYGAGLLAGASSILTVAVLGWLLWRARRVVPVAGFAIGAGLMLTPWLAHTNAALGKPVLTTNSGFNLYLGNNPAADGRFLSIADTPAGPEWEAMRKELGEVGASETLGEKAQGWIAAHPEEAGKLAAKKLALFWMPNLPDAADVVADAKIAAARWIDVAQHVLILGFALWALMLYRRDPEVRIVAATVIAFWAVHALTYIIVRYRDPVMPLMIVLAAMPVPSWFERRRA